MKRGLCYWLGVCFFALVLPKVSFGQTTYASPACTVSFYQVTTGSSVRSSYFYGGSAVTALTTDSSNNVYVGDSTGIVKVQSNGNFTTLTTQVTSPLSLTVDTSGNVFALDSTGDTIYEISNGTVSPFASLTTLGFSFTAIVVDSNDNIFGIDTVNSEIREISSGTASVFVPSLAANGIAIDGSNNLYVTTNSQVLTISPGGTVTPVAGTSGVTGAVDATGAAAEFNNPTQLALDSFGDIYVNDTGNFTLRLIVPGGTVMTLAGTPGTSVGAGSSTGTAATALLGSNQVLAASPAGKVFLVDTNSGTVLVGGIAVTVSPPNLDLTFGQSVPGSGTNSGYNVDYDYYSSNAYLGGGNFGNYDGSTPPGTGTYTVATIVDDGNYIGIDDSGSLTIAQATQTVTMQPAGPFLLNQNIALSASDTAGAITFSFSSTDASDTTLLDGDGDVAGTITGNNLNLTEAGVSFTIYALTSGDPNYSGASSAGQSGQGLQPATVTFTDSSLNYTYTGSPIVPNYTTSVPALNSDGTATYVYTDTSTNTVVANATNPGTYNVQLTVTDATYGGTVSGTMVINPASPGSLQVTISPAGAVTAGAQWQVDGGALQNSGDTVTGLSVGSHTLSFTTVSGYTTPANQNITISSGEAATATGTYTQGTGSLQVTISPAGAVTAGAKWSVDGGALQNSGATVTGISVGSHTVSFSTVTGYTTPADQEVTVSLNQTTDATGTYVAQVGSLQVTISPAGAITAGAKWQVDGGALQISGATVTGLSVGSHTVAFNAIKNYTAPSSQLVTISNNQTTTATGTYTGPSGSLQVTLAPAAAASAGATWQVDGGADQISGATVSGLSVGSHTLTYNAPSGYSAPATATVKISANATTKETGTYLDAAIVNLTIPSPATYTGKAIAVTATTTPPGLKVTISFTQNGKTASPVNAGSYLVTGTVNTSTYRGTATGTLVISPAAETVTLTGLSTPYTSKAVVPVVTTSPVAKVAVSYAYTGTASSTTAPIAVGSYPVTVTISNPNYTGSATGSIAIAQPVSFPGTPTSLLSAASTQVSVQVNPGGFATSVHFIYGTTSGNLDLQTASQTLSASKTPLTVTGFFGELQPNQTYYYEVVTTGPAGTFTGPLESFTTLPGFDTTLVAATGQTATGTGSTFASFGSSAVNENDGAAFNAKLATGSDTIWANTTTVDLSLLAQTGTAAPGAGGATFATLTDPVYDDHQDIAFSGTYKSGSTTVTGLWYAASGSSPQLLAYTGMAAPGLGGATFQSFSALGVGDADGAIISGTLATNKTLGIGTTNNEVVYEGLPSSLTLILRNGDTVVTTTGSKTIGSFKFAPATTVISGQTRSFGPASGVLIANVTYTDSSSDNGIVVLAAPESPVEVETFGDVAPGASPATFATFSTPAINDNDDVAFKATLSTKTDNTGIWADNSSGDLELVAQFGDPTFGFTALGDPVYNDNEAVAFLATFKSGSKSVAGVFCNSTGTLQAVAQVGGQAPGCPTGVTFSAFTALALDNVGGATQQGGVTFLATLTGTGVSSANNTAIFSVDTSGNLQLIVRTGDILDTSTGVTPVYKTVSALSFLPTEASTNAIVADQTRSLSPVTGDLIYTATFTDKSQGIFNVVFP